MRASTLPAGWAIMDCGAMRAVCGEAAWNKIVDYLSLRNMEPEIDRENKDFRFWRWSNGALTFSGPPSSLCWQDLEAADRACAARSHPTASCTSRPWDVVANYGKKTVGSVTLRSNRPSLQTGTTYSTSLMSSRMS